MADHSIVALVTKDPSAPNGTGFKWSYSVDGESFLDTPAPIHVPHGEKSKIAVSILAGGPSGDTCVFVTDPEIGPLTFTDEDGHVPNTDWLQGLTPIGLAAITFVDDNSENDNKEDKTYHLLINMVYLSDVSFTVKASPDPTIVNEGTDHPRPDALSSPERTEPVAVAV